MDRTGANFFKVVEGMKLRLKASPVPMVIPIGAEESFTGVVDLIMMKAIIWDEASQGMLFDYRDIPAELVAHLVCSPAAVGLCGAELATGAGWFGLRSHPGPIGSISFGGPALPEWFDPTLRQVAQPR
jgi:hypothetical protein